MKGKIKMFCTKCGAKLSDQAKFCTSCGERIEETLTQNKKKHPILIALIVVVVLFIIIAACGDTSDVVGDNSTENTLESEEIIITDTPTISEPNTEPTPVTTEEHTDGSKYPKSYNEKGELIVYWLDSGNVWHESEKCGTVVNADSSKLHSGTPNEAYANGKKRACKTCSADSTVVITETTRVPETASAPETTRTFETTHIPETTRIPETTETTETTKTPDTTSAPETTSSPKEEEKYPKTYDKNGKLIVYWFKNGDVWHESKECHVIKISFLLNLNEGSAIEAYTNGKTSACKICSSDSTVVIPEITTMPETTSVPETTHTPETTHIPETTYAPENTRAPETTNAPETTSAPETSNAPEITHTPETTCVPETTRTPEATDVLESDIPIFWIDAGYVWHYSTDCWTLGNTEPSSIHTGIPLDAYTAGMLRGCLVCAGDALYTPSEDICIISYPKTARRNETVSVTIQALPNTTYHIVVNYKSGPSKSKDLEEKVSDSDGIVTWTWKVGARSAAGTFDIIVKDDEGKSVTVEWTVVVD